MYSRFLSCYSLNMLPCPHYETCLSCDDNFIMSVDGKVFVVAVFQFPASFVAVNRHIEFLILQAL